MESNGVTNWLTGRAWSRAGAVAVAISSGRPRSVVVFGVRILLLVGGSLLIAIAVATMLWNSFGPGPLDVFIVGLRDVTGLPITFAYWAAFGVMLLLALVLGRRPGPGTIVTPLILGPVVQFLLLVYGRVDAPDSFWVHVVVHVLAIGVAGVGAGALIVSGLGAGTGELLASAASDRTGRAEPHVRFGFEMAWLVVGVLFGGPIGVGTIIVAALIGPAVAVGHHLVEGVVDSSRRRVVVVPEGPRIPADTAAR